MFRWLVAGMLVTAAARAESEPPLAAPNAHGVAMGHVHFTVRDVESNVKFWTDLGGMASRDGGTAIIRFPDIFVVLTEGIYEGNSQGAVVNHISFRVDDLARIEPVGYGFEYYQGEFPGIATLHTPEGERVELFDDSATNIGFTVDQGAIDAVADRHNQKHTVPITSHHMHFYLPEEDVIKAKEWYATNFGGVAGKRWHYDAVDLPGINLNFSKGDSPMAPTRGRMLDHIGFEVANLESFCKTLAEQGVVCEAPANPPLPGVKSAFLVDPWGTTIELTEGLRQ